MSMRMCASIGRGGQQRPQLAGDRVRLAAELAPGDAHHAVAHGLEGAIAGSVALERLARGVDREAVELDDQALLRPGRGGLLRAEGPVSWRAGGATGGEGRGGGP